MNTASDTVNTAPLMSTPDPKAHPESPRVPWRPVGLSQAATMAG